MSPDTVSALRARGVEARWAPAAEQPWFRPDAQGDLYLTHRNGGCVFLQPDRRCFLHAEFGEAAKPAFCRIFPLRFTSGPAGLTATIRPECSQYHSSHRDGAPIEDAIAALEGVAVPVRRVQDVALLPGRALPGSAWPAIESDLLATVAAQDGSPEALVAALRPALGLPVGGDAARYRQAATALLYVLDRSLADAGDTPHRAALAGVSARLAAPLPALDPSARRYVRLVVRGHIAAADFHPLGSVSAGLGRVLLELLLARLDSPAAAPLSAARLGTGLSRWGRLTNNPTLLPILRVAAPALLDLTRHAPGQDAKPAV